MSQSGRGRGRHSEPSYGSDAPSFNYGRGDICRGWVQNTGAAPSFQSELGPSHGYPRVVVIPTTAQTPSSTPLAQTLVSRGLVPTQSSPNWAHTLSSVSWNRN
ncbi:hypothetical protein ACFX13_014108 [Malus domestica]